jgi:hypothetical protein
MTRRATSADERNPQVLRRFSDRTKATGKAHWQGLGRENPLVRSCADESSMEPVRPIKARVRPAMHRR